MQHQDILSGMLAFAFLLTPIAITSVATFLLDYKARSISRSKQLQFIESYEFSEGLKEKFAKNHLFLDDESKELVFTALKDYFHLCNQAGRSMVSMPSQIVDDAWHEFILFTKDYQDFCTQAFDRFLHHTPAEAMTTQTEAQAGIRRAWRLACAKEGINPQKPERLPLIFAIDEQLKIEKGFFYRLDCLSNSSTNSAHQINQMGTGVHYYCGTHIGCATGCTGISGYSGDSSGHSSHGCCGYSCGGGCSGGCSGGCGGGCGGGGCGGG